jgi:hypothetical protein
MHKPKKNRGLSNIRQIRHKDLVRLYDWVVVKIPEGERECVPADVKPGEIVEIPDRWGDLQFFKVLPDLS